MYEKGKPIYIASDGTVNQGQRDPVFQTNENGLIKTDHFQYVRGG